MAEMFPGAKGTLLQLAMPKGGTATMPRLTPFTKASTAAAPVKARSVSFSPRGTGEFQFFGTICRYVGPLGSHWER